MAREMKDSGVEWIGEIPKDWLVRKIKHSFRVFAGATPKSEKPEYWNGDISWITPADYKTEEKYVYTGRKNISMEGYKSCGTTIVPKGSVIFSKRAPVGTVAISGNELCTNQGCLACVPFETVDSIYNYYTISVLTEQFELVSSGTTFKEISANSFVNFPLPFPIYEEQIKISSFLDKKCAELNKVIEKTRESIEEYKKLKQAVITQAVTKGIRGDRETKDSCNIRWGKIPSDWSLIRIKNCIIDLKSGLSSVTNDENAGESGYYVLRTSAVSSGVFLPKEVKPVLTSAINRLVCPVEKDTIVVSRMNTSAMVGTCAYVDNEYPGLFLPDKLWKIHIKRKYYTKYFWYVINSIPARSLFDEISTGASMSMQNISVTDFVNNYVTVPPLDEQKEIVHYLDQKCSVINELITKKEKYLSEIENYKKSLIYEYVAGKKEVPQEYQK